MKKNKDIPADISCRDCSHAPICELRNYLISKPDWQLLADMVGKVCKHWLNKKE